GKTFLTLDDGLRRDDANKDIQSLLDWIAQQPGLDAKRVMLDGASFGGYVALSVAAKDPTRVAAVSSYAGLTKLVTFLVNGSTIGADEWRREIGDVRSGKLRSFLQSIAPVNIAKRINLPLFITIGNNDPGSSVEENRQIVAAARNNGAPAWFLLGEDEGHGFS